MSAFIFFIVTFGLASIGYFNFKSLTTSTSNGLRYEKASAKQKQFQYKHNSFLKKAEPAVTHSDPVAISPNIIRWDRELLSKLEWKVFENVCMEYLRIKNCDANVTCTGADGGIDITVKDTQGKTVALAQCKSWNKPIGVSLIRELYGIMAAEHVKLGVFLTTSSFSQDAKQFAKEKALILIDGNEFIKSVNSLDSVNRSRIDKFVSKEDFSIPTCVHCNIKLVKRTVKTGQNKGKIFWGCANYPRCKVTMHLTKGL